MQIARQNPPQTRQSLLTSLRSSIKTGRLVSSAISNGSNHALGMTSTDTLITVKPALVGDLNLDGTVSISDFIQLAANFGATAATWEMGDLNYDDQVSISDLIDLSASFGQSFSGEAAIPDRRMAASAVELSSSDVQKRAHLLTTSKLHHGKHVIHHRHHRPQ